MLSSCSMPEKTTTISVMMTGHRKVTCTAVFIMKYYWWMMSLTHIPDILRRMTLKQRKTAAWTSGDTGTVRRHSDRRSGDRVMSDC